MELAGGDPGRACRAGRGDLAGNQYVSLSPLLVARCLRWPVFFCGPLG